jgi:hypothetical protein
MPKLCWKMSAETIISITKLRKPFRKTYLDLGFDAGDRIARINVQRDGRARERLDKHLPASGARDGQSMRTEIRFEICGLNECQGHAPPTHTESVQHLESTIPLLDASVSEAGRIEMQRKEN